jgi:hypothetical protein
MASEFPASSSSQQPFANPQPAPLPAASQATSPPTKQSLKSWWKGFRPPTKSHDSPGKYPSSKDTSLPQKYFVSERFVSKVPRNLDTLFQEYPMDESASSIDGLPVEDASSAFPTRRTSYQRTISFQDAHQPRHTRHSSGSFIGSQSPAKFQRPMTANPASVRRAWHRPPTPSPQRNGSSRRQAFAADNSSENSLLGAGILPGPRARPLSHFFGGLMFSHQTSSSSGQSAKKTMKAAEQPTGIFGVPLRQSISYANVAISLVDAEGKSYIYGYVPIVVAKCGVYLKEKGSCCP